MFGLRVLLLINPKSRRGAADREEVSSQLNQAGFRIVTSENFEPTDYPAVIEKHQNQVDLVVVGGGDGSVNAALPGILRTQLPLGVIPMGTANNLARTLQIPASVAEASQVIIGGHQKRIDVGSVNGKYFLNMAGMGLSTQINRGVPPALKRRWGVLGYIYYGLKVMKKVRPFWVDIRTSDQQLCIRSLQMIICNGRHYGSGLTVEQDARIDDQKLDLCSIEAKHWTDGVRLARAMKKGDYAGKPEVFVLKEGTFEIRTRRPMAIDTDGEVSTHTPAKFSILPRAIAVYVPQQAQEIGREPPGIAV